MLCLFSFHVLLPPLFAYFSHDQPDPLGHGCTGKPGDVVDAAFPPGLIELKRLLDIRTKTHIFHRIPYRDTVLTLLGQVPIDLPPRSSLYSE